MLPWAAFLILFHKIFCGLLQRFVFIIDSDYFTDISDNIVKDSNCEALQNIKSATYSRESESCPQKHE